MSGCYSEYVRGKGDEIKQNKVSTVVADMPVYKGMEIFATDAETKVIEGATDGSKRGEKLDAIGISSEQVDKKYVDSMTVSYGYVFSSEEKWNSVYDIAKAADKRMYKSKANFYREKERDRRK